MNEVNEKKIKSYISLKSDYWENILKTNCYAFALGLDVPEHEIFLSAYQLGFMAKEKFNIPLCEIKEMTYEQRLLLDLKALKIAYEVIKDDKIVGYYEVGNYVCNYWDILLFSHCSHRDFHFARRGYDGKLYHKMGYWNVPAKCSETAIEKEGYRLVRKYRLRYWERNESLL